MLFGDLISKSVSSSVTLTSAEAELLTLLKKFIYLITSGAMTDMQDLPEVYKKLLIKIYGGILR